MSTSSLPWLDVVERAKRLPILCFHSRDVLSEFFTWLIQGNGVGIGADLEYINEYSSSFLLLFDYVLFVCLLFAMVYVLELSPSATHTHAVTPIKEWAEGINVFIPLEHFLKGMLKTERVKDPLVRTQQFITRERLTDVRTDAKRVKSKLLLVFLHRVHALQTISRLESDS